MNTAKQTAQKDSFHYSQDSLLSRMAQLDGTAFEYAYDEKKLLQYAKSTEGMRYSFAYNDKGLPVSVVGQADRMSASVTVGRKYFIRQKKSGKYLDTHQGDVNGSNIHQYQFNGSVDQTWKVEDAGDGYVKFIVQAGNATRALDVANGADADGTNVQLYDDDGTVAQKFRLKPMASGGYQILAKCSNDRRAVEVAWGSLDNMGNVQIKTAGEEPAAEQVWYFEPADEATLSDGPGGDGMYRIRVRHSGQYLTLEDEVNAVGKKLQQKYYEDTDAQQFVTVSAGDDYYYLSPMHARDKYLDVRTTGSDGYYRVTLSDTTEADSKKFKFALTGTGYAIENKNGLQFDVMNSSFVSGWVMPPHLKVRRQVVGRHS